MKAIVLSVVLIGCNPQGEPARAQVGVSGRPAIDSIAPAISGPQDSIILRIVALCDWIRERNFDAVSYMVDYPLRVNYAPGKSKFVKSKKELKANWSKIFTPKLLEILRPPVEPWKHKGNDLYALPRGDLWFSDEGRLVSVNLRDDSPWHKRSE